MPDIISILSQYCILEITAEHLSTLDLFRLAITCSELYALIRQSNTLFDYLRRVGICDGRGLLARQQFWGVYDSVKTRGYSTCIYDEELEVRVWNLKCDTFNALPCLRCGLNFCEECRYVPRVEYAPDERSRRLPHGEWYNYSIIGYCAPCDEKIQRDLPPCLSERCDCDQYKRWICLPCKMDEDRLDERYFATRTRLYWDERDEWDSNLLDGLMIDEVLEQRALWCPCGERVPRDGNVRCAWCKRKHDQETWRQGRDFTTPFDHDPCYPRLPNQGPQGEYRYANLGYTGPIAE